MKPVIQGELEALRGLVAGLSAEVARLRDEVRALAAPDRQFRSVTLVSTVGNPTSTTLRSHYGDPNGFVYSQAGGDFVFDTSNDIIWMSSGAGFSSWIDVGTT